MRLGLHTLTSSVTVEVYPRAMWIPRYLCSNSPGLTLPRRVLYRAIGNKSHRAAWNTQKYSKAFKEIWVGKARHIYWDFGFRQGIFFHVVQHLVLTIPNELSLILHTKELKCSVNWRSVTEPRLNSWSIERPCPQLLFFPLMIFHSALLLYSLFLSSYDFPHFSLILLYSNIPFVYISYPKWEGLFRKRWGNWG